MKRRSFLLGLTGTLAAPAVVPLSSLMKLWVPPAPKWIPFYFPAEVPVRISQDMVESWRMLTASECGGELAAQFIVSDLARMAYARSIQTELLSCA